MKPITYLTFLYSILVTLSGLMSFQYANQLSSLFIEVTLGIIVFISVIFMIKKKKIANYTAIASSFSLIFYYGYFFSQYISFFSGAMAAFSFLITALLFIKIFHLPEPD